MGFSAAGITIIKSLFEAVFSNSYSIQNVPASELYMKGLKSHLPGARLKFLLHKYHTREDLIPQMQCIIQVDISTDINLCYWSKLKSLEVGIFRDPEEEIPSSHAYCMVL